MTAGVVLYLTPLDRALGSLAPLGGSDLCIGRNAELQLKGRAP